MYRLTINICIISFGIHIQVCANIYFPSCKIISVSYTTM